MATRTVNFDKKGVEIILKGISRPIRHAKPFFASLASLVDQSTQLTFRLKGARSGMSKWIDYGKGKGVEVYRYKNGNWAKRPGTDGAKSRRYSKKSQLLQASTGFRKSFKKLKVSRDQMIYGTNFPDKLAKNIMLNPTRRVLFVTDKDLRLYNRNFRTFIDRGIKF